MSHVVVIEMYTKLKFNFCGVEKIKNKRKEECQLPVLADDARDQMVP